MFGPSGESERRRTRLMPAVLFGLLLLSVAVAAWLVYSRGVPVRRAAELLAEIRGKGLAQFFPASASRWFLIQSEGKTVGWQLARSHRRNDARFEGIHVTVRFSSRGAERLWEWWLLDEAATEGFYQAGAISRSALGWRAALASRISLKDGRVFATQPLSRDPMELEASAPENYLPEGLLDLAMRLVAQRKTQAQFKVLLIEMGPLGQTTSFATFLMRHRPTNEGLFPTATAGLDLQVHGRWKRSEQAYFFDARGRLVGRLRGHEVFLPASGEQVRARFPTAVIVLAAVGRQTGFPQFAEDAPNVRRLFWPTGRPQPGAPDAEGSDSTERETEGSDLHAPAGL